MVNRSEINFLNYEFAHTMTGSIDRQPFIEYKEIIAGDRADFWQNGVCYSRFSAASTRSGVIGSWYNRAPEASKMALARTAPIPMMAGSPPPWAG